MSKADSLKHRFGAVIAQTVGQRPGVAPPIAAAETDRYAGATRSRTFGEMPVGEILADAQPRTEFKPEDLERLAESVKRFGQLAPIRVRFDAARGKWVVLVGERRLRACKLAGLERVRVEFVEREMTEADMLAEQVVENVVRADLQPVEEGRAYRRLMELNGWNAQQLAETLGVEPTSVYRALALVRLPEEVAALVDAGEIKPTAAYEIAKLQIADDQRAVAELIVAEALDHKGTVEEVRRRRSPRSGKGRGAGKGRKLTSRVFRTPTAKVAVELRKGGGAEAIRDALAEALRQAEDAMAPREQSAA
jgi:ParB family chromosome partitioning protein